MNWSILFLVSLEGQTSLFIKKVTERHQVAAKMFHILSRVTDILKYKIILWTKSAISKSKTFKTSVSNENVRFSLLIMKTKGLKVTRLNYVVWCNT